MAAAFGVTVQFALLNRHIETLRRLNKTVVVWLGGSFACDILITLTMVIVLLQAREATSYKSSKGVLSSLIVHTIENGMITTVCALADLICFLVLPDTWFYVCL